MDLSTEVTGYAQKEIQESYEPPIGKCQPKGAGKGFSTKGYSINR